MFYYVCTGENYLIEPGPSGTFPLVISANNVMFSNFANLAERLRFLVRNNGAAVARFVLLKDLFCRCQVVFQACYLSKRQCTGSLRALVNLFISTSMLTNVIKAAVLTRPRPYGIPAKKIEMAHRKPRRCAC